MEIRPRSGEKEERRKDGKKNVAVITRLSIIVALLYLYSANDTRMCFLDGLIPINKMLNKDVTKKCVGQKNNVSIMIQDFSSFIVVPKLLSLW